MQEYRLKTLFTYASKEETYMGKINLPDKKWYNDHCPEDIKLTFNQKAQAHKKDLKRIFKTGLDKTSLSGLGYLYFLYALENFFMDHQQTNVHRKQNSPLQEAVNWQRSYIKGYFSSRESYISLINRMPTELTQLSCPVEKGIKFSKAIYPENGEIETWVFEKDDIKKPDMKTWLKKI